MKMLNNIILRDKGTVLKVIPKITFISMTIDGKIFIYRFNNDLAAPLKPGDEVVFDYTINAHNKVVVQNLTVENKGLHKDYIEIIEASLDGAQQLVMFKIPTILHMCLVKGSEINPFKWEEGFKEAYGLELIGRESFVKDGVYSQEYSYLFKVVDNAKISI